MRHFGQLEMRQSSPFEMLVKVNAGRKDDDVKRD
jgi:hypothetical protein